MMHFIRLIQVLYQMKLLSPVGLYKLLSAIRKYGMNLMALLGYAGKVYSNRIAIVDERETLNYSQLLSQVEQLAILIQRRYGIQSGHKVGIISKNHACLVKSIFAISQLGADVYLLNVEMSQDQFDHLLVRHDFQLIVYDAEVKSLIESSSYSREKIATYHRYLPAINSLLNADITNYPQQKRSTMGKLVILTGGTTGQSKAAEHKPFIFNYLNPFVALITRLKLQKYRTVYIATPIYHGYGVAQCLLFTAMGAKIVIRQRFDAAQACALIKEHQVEVVTVVPLMIHRMLKQDVSRLSSLARIVSGSAELDPKLVEEVRGKLGDIVCNLYGTSEAGLNIIATPQDLRLAANTIGRKIQGVKLQILDDNKNEVEAGKIGQLCILNKLSQRNGQAWIETGDLGYRDDQGLYYLCGRIDDRIVSAGINVYPMELEQVLNRHPLIEIAAVIGVPDDEFGQRLKAFVQLENNTSMTQEQLLEWLRPRLARYQMPQEITFVSALPYTAVGKLNKKVLKELI